MADGGEDADADSAAGEVAAAGTSVASVQLMRITQTPATGYLAARNRYQFNNLLYMRLSFPFLPFPSSLMPLGDSDNFLPVLGFSSRKHIRIRIRPPPWIRRWHVVRPRVCDYDCASEPAGSRGDPLRGGGPGGC